MGDSWRDECKKQKIRTWPATGEARVARNREALDKRRQAIKRQQSRRALYRGPKAQKASQDRLIDA